MKDQHSDDQAPTVEAEGEAFALTVVEGENQAENHDSDASELPVDEENDEANEVDGEAVGPLQRVVIPVNFMQAALSCASTEETRYYLNGVFLHVVEENVRIVATDGHRLFIGAFKPVLGDGEELPDWLKKGVIVSSERLSAKLGIVSKFSEGDCAFLSYGTNQPHLVLSDLGEEAVFRCREIEGAFPDYSHIVEQMGGVTDLTDEHLKDFQSVTFQGQYLKAAGEVAKILGGKEATVSVMASGPENPALMTFPSSEGALLVLLPYRNKNPISEATRSILAPAMSRSVAALRAHLTRNTEAATTAATAAEKAVFLDKAAQYEKRITDLINLSNGQTALPAPEEDDKAEGQFVAEGEPIAETVSKENTDTEQTETAEQADAVEQVETAKAEEPKKLSKAERRKAKQAEKTAAAA